MSFLDLRPTDAPAIIPASGDDAITFRQLLDDAKRLGRSLASDKLVVLVRSRNDRLSVTSYLAAQLGGHAVALIDGSKPSSEHSDMLERYRPDVVFGSAGTAAELEAMGVAPDSVEEVLGGELVTLPAAGGERPHPDLALLLGTSGTTGSTKYVRLSQRSIEANARSIASYIGIGPDERPITVLPLHYSFGLSVLNSHWLAGAALVLTTESVMQQSFWSAVAEHGCTSLALSLIHI